jgi:tyrosyl-tRNA synthetase
MTPHDEARTTPVMNAQAPRLSDDALALLEGTAEVHSPAELDARLRAGKRLRVKFGIDPTGSELHLGHAVVLHKMQQYVAMGHDVILLIGDFTARIGDPSGRNDSRPLLTDEMIEANMQTYRAQAGKVLDLERVTVRWNSEWLAKLTLADLIRELSKVTVAQMLERNDFAKRYGDGTPISLHEFLYPVAQALDSVALEADVELGGTDQLFNFLLARDYQRAAGQAEQICMTSPILVGTDGVVRMGKSKGNYIGLTEPANDQFGKLMSIPDAAMPIYAQLAAFDARLIEPSAAPMEQKKRIAEAVVTKYHGADAARAARDYFERTVQRKEVPDEMPEFVVPADGAKLADLILLAGFAESKRAAQRLVGEHAVKLDSVVQSDPNARCSPTAPTVLQVGARRYARLLPPERS